jgi:hypothetical protein
MSNRDLFALAETLAVVTQDLVAILVDKLREWLARRVPNDLDFDSDDRE